jgi:hypothetical protein
MVRIIKGIGGIVLGGLLLAACNGGTGSDGGTPISDADMIGIWTILTMHEKGTETTTFPGQPPQVENTDSTTTFGAGTTIEFKADKTCQVNMGFPITGTWSTAGSSLTIITSILGQTDTATSTVTLEGKNATLVEHDKGTQTFSGITIERDMVTTIKAVKQ